MPEFKLSAVNIVPDAHKDAINQIAELYGCGPNNLSVKLQDGEGNLYWACHAWWNPDDYALFSDDELRAEIVPPELAESLTYLYERIVLDGDSIENREAALTELGLSLVDQPDI